MALAKAMGLNPATVLEMVRKLTEKGLMQLLSSRQITTTYGKRPEKSGADYPQTPAVESFPGKKASLQME